MDIDTTKPGLPGFVIIGRKAGDNAYTGYIELSFSMGILKDRTRFWWTGTGTDNLFGLKHTVDGRADAEGHLETLKSRWPDYEWEVWDVEDPALPIAIDWPRWHSSRPNKYEDRNPVFSMKEDADA